MTTSSSPPSSNDGAGAPAVEARRQQQQQEASQEPRSNHTSSGYSVDIRVFLASITVAMALSFIAGVGLGGPDVASEIGVAVVEQQQQHGATRMMATPAPGTAAGGKGNNNEPARRPAASVDLDSLSEEEAAKMMSEAAMDGGEEHLPAGQHLLVDIEGVSAEFLNSEERLSKAMVDTVDAAQLTLLSYHCHSLVPSGVSCVGVLLESHISFHTWPEEGVITLDLFTCGSKPLLPVVKTIEKLFGIDRGDGVTKINSKWSHELRGFRPEEAKRKNYLDGSSDLSLWVLSPLEMYSKEQIYSEMTKFQRVDIWDIREVTDAPSYKDVLKYNMTPGDPRLLTPEYATPDRLLFLDGILQSLRSTESIYHEAMVHPAMFAHPKPENVVVVGGGEGATLREVLKHNTVKKATMIELDEELVGIAREYLPDMSDCSDLLGRSKNCMDDEIVTMHYGDGRDWFLERYGASPAVTSDAEEPSKSSREPIDVILVDTLDPEEDNTDIAELLYADEHFIASLMRSLSDDGVLAIQIGTAATIDDPRADVGIYRNRERLFELLEANEDVAAMLVYEEPHCGFLEPHSFLIVCKSADCRGRWYARADLVDYWIYERIVRTHSKDRALTYYDGTTQHSYQWPKKGWETVYCRREPTPFECAYRNLNFKAEIHEYEIDDEEESSFRSEVSEDGKKSRVYATVDIPKGSYIMPTHLASSLEVTDRNLEGLHRNVEIGGGRVSVIEDLLEFFDEYAHKSSAEGSNLNYVEVGGSCLIRRVGEGSGEVPNIEPWLPPHPDGKRPKYSPVYERHRVSFDVFMVASRDIKDGEEILMDEKMWQKAAN